VTQRDSGARSLRVVILGAGFGGLEAARAMARASVEITLIDRHNHHLFQPLLYQVATAALSPGDIAWPIRAIFRRQRNLSVVMAEVTGIDTAARVVQAGAELAIPYDALVLATGATHSYFGHDEWAPVAPGLKTIEDATDIRRRLLLAFERAEVTEDAVERRRLLTFVVIGAGPTGVELAGAMSELARHAMPREFRRIDPAMARVVLVEAGPRVLPTFPEELGGIARRSLKAMAVQVLTDTRVTACTATGVECGEERISAGTIVWAAGVVASPAGAWIGAERDRAGRIQVGADLAVPGQDSVYAVGDLAAVTDGKGKPIPGNAPAAKQMGRYVGQALAARAAGRPGMRLTGLIGWWFWGIAHVWYLIGFRSRVVVSFEWLWSYLTFQRGARLITGREPRGGNAAQIPGAVTATQHQARSQAATAKEAEGIKATADASLGLRNPQ
jgi:NADH dehydrogenase